MPSDPPGDVPQLKVSASKVADDMLFMLNSHQLVTLPSGKNLAFSPTMIVCLVRGPVISLLS